MRFDAIITLVAPGGFASDAIGQQVPADPVRRTIHANEFAVSATESYAAGAQGLKADCQYQVRSIDYEGEELFEVGDVEYTIIRVERRGEWTRLTGERKRANG